MTQAYAYPKPLKVPGEGTKARRIRDGCITEMERLGWETGNLRVRGRATSARFVFYRLVAEGVMTKSYSGSRTPAQDVSVALTDLRETGVFPFDAVVDEGRESEDYTGWTNLYAGAESAARNVRLDPWIIDEETDDATDPMPHLWVESGSLLTLVRPLASRYRVPVAASRGQASLSLCWELAQRTPDATTILYLGDLDLSGGHIESSLVERVQVLGNAVFDVERLAITHEQVQAHGLTVIPKYDKRTKSYNDSVETEALGQERIEQLVHDRLAEMLRTRTPHDTIEDVEATEREQRAEMIADLFPRQ